MEGQPNSESEPAGEVGGDDDPMASIRPELPGGPPGLEATVALPGLAFRSGYDDSEDASTLRPVLREPSDGHELETHDSRPPLITLRESATPAPPGGPPAAYELREKIGVGGMGEAWAARQYGLGRPVALKRLREGKQAPRSVLVQFESEARLTGILDHPNIVTVHELGRDQEGRPFYTMKLIDGTPWSELLGSSRSKTGAGELELRDHLDILLEVSQAIGFAHSRGILHRDIKPANVMVGGYGEVLVVDWGLAVALEDLDALGGARTWTIASLPRAALVCGTPAYMPPETAAAAVELIRPWTDVYMLGAVLYHILYGRPPHKGKTVKQVIAKAKVNAWTFPGEVSGRLKPWDALLRPVIHRALATDPELRYVDAGMFGEALREAIRNYDSAKAASRAQDELDELDLSQAPADSGYRELSGLIAKLEGALESWPRNIVAHQTLCRAHLELARLALHNGDLSLARVSLDAYRKLPPLPEPRPDRYGRRVTLHPVDSTLIGAPRPTDTLVAAGTSAQWVSSADLVRSPGALSRSIDAGATLGRAGTLGPQGTLEKLADDDGELSISSVASVAIPERGDEQVRDEQQQLRVRAVELLDDLDRRERGLRKRRLALWGAAGLAGVLAVTVAVSVFTGQRAVQAERDRARAERDSLSRVLLDETANTVEAQLDTVIAPVHAALMTSVRWARAGELDTDDPRALNGYFIPLLGAIEGATSMLRADAVGNEYMLLEREDGWRTRITKPGVPRELRDWTTGGDLIEVWHDEEPYDPHVRPWFIGGAALRDAARRARLDREPHPVFWTEPYPFYTTKDLGISVSAPATSPSGREFVIAFDVKFNDVSTITGRLPVGIERGQVFVLDENLRVLGLPRETKPLSPARRKQLLLTPMAELDEAPISRAAFAAWRERDGGDNGPFRLELGDEDVVWVGLRHVTRADRPRVWIGVVVPESHFLDLDGS